MKLKMSFFD